MNRVSLESLNAADKARFTAALGDIYEHAPWVAQTVYGERPFGTLAALHDAMMSAVRAAPADQRLALIKGHPDLAGKAARAGAMTNEFHGRTGERRSRSPVGRGVCPIPPPQQRLSGKIWHPVHRLRAAAQQGLDPAAVRAPRAERHGGRDRSGARRNFPHRRASPRSTGCGRRSAQGAWPPVDPCARHPCRPAGGGRGGRACAIVRQRRARRDRTRDHQPRRPHRRAIDRRHGHCRSGITNCGFTLRNILQVSARPRATRRSSIWCRSGSRWPSPKAIITCRCW